jgi:subtilisin family serine protease
VAAETFLRANGDLTGPFEGPVRDTHERLFEAGVRIYRHGGGEPLPDVVNRLKESAQAGLGTSARVVSLNYGLTGQPKYHGGPASEPRLPSAPVALPREWGGDRPVVLVVLDTGLADPQHLGAPVSVVTDLDDVDGLVPDGDPPGSPLAAEAGHGTFIAGIVDRMAQGTVRIAVERVLNPDGWGHDADIAEALLRIPEKYPTAEVVSMSFGAYTDDDTSGPLGLDTAITLLRDHVALVASAGNDAEPLRPCWPAAHPDVVGVASVRRDAGGFVPSEFSNSGPSADVCTIGEDLISVYVKGEFEVSDDLPLVPFTDYAVWSGTSFAAPVVAAEIARRTVADQVDGLHAWESLAFDLPPAPAAGTPLAGFGPVYDPLAFVGIDPTSPVP